MNDHTKEVNALCQQHNDDYNAEYKVFQERMEPITKKFEEDVEKVLAP